MSYRADTPWRAAALLATVLLGACAGRGPVPGIPVPGVSISDRAAPWPPAAADCLVWLQTLDRLGAEHRVMPSSPAPIEGFPHLRVSRFLASFALQPLHREQTAVWLRRLAAAAADARRSALLGLPEAARRELAGPDPQPPNARLEDCHGRLLALDPATPERLALLRRRARVQADYRTWQRVLGLYPLSSPALAAGVRAYQRRTRETFATPLRRLPLAGRLRRYYPPQGNATAPETPPLDALGVPAPGRALLQRLRDYHAPVWEIDIAGAFDLPGAPRWRGPRRPGLDPTTAVSYFYPSYTRWQGRSLLQLNYLIWFAERPRRGVWDILAGALDGLHWRVTLDGRRVLLYDTIHPCGCYHYLLPSDGLRPAPAAAELAEPPLLVQPAPRLARGQRAVIRVASASHYIQRVYGDAAIVGSAPGAVSYRWRDYRQLYRLPAADGTRRSLFDADGLVAGSERPERWLLWPSGVPSPGAMRERGRHAIAFVGTRHFDDPGLLQRFFLPSGHSASLSATLQLSAPQSRRSR